MHLFIPVALVEIQTQGLQEYKVTHSPEGKLNYVCLQRVTCIDWNIAAMSRAWPELKVVLNHAFT